MRLTALPLLLAIVAQPLGAQAPSTASAPGASLANMSWLAGCWSSGPGKSSRTEEFWTSPSDHLMLSVTRYFEGGKANSWEFTRLEASDSGVVWAVLAPGGPELRYRLTAHSADSFDVENLKEKPQRFVYRRSGDTTVSIRVEEPGSKLTVGARRVSCPGPTR